MTGQHPTTIIVDSQLQPGEAIRSNPQRSVCPRRILNHQCLITVHYIGFDGALHRGQIVVHEDVTTDIHDFFLLAQAIRFPIAKVVPLAHPDYLWDRDKTVLQGNLTYGFNYRTVHGTQHLSAHAEGRAIDVNPMQNPCIRCKEDEIIVWPPAKWQPDQPGTLTANNPLVQLMESRGWQWGGRWIGPPNGNVVDYMHFAKPA